MRILFRQVQPAIGSETAQQDFGECFRGHIAACGDVFHKMLASFLVPSPLKEGGKGEGENLTPLSPNPSPVNGREECVTYPNLPAAAWSPCLPPRPIPRSS